MPTAIRKDLEAVRAELLRAFVLANECHRDARVQQLSRQFDRVLNLYMQANQGNAMSALYPEGESVLPGRTASLRP